MDTCPVRYIALSLVFYFPSKKFILRGNSLVSVCVNGLIVLKMLDIFLRVTLNIFYMSNSFFIVFINM